MKQPLVGICVAMTLTITAPVHADAGDEAQTLFDEAKTLILQGHWGEACPKLARSNQLDPRATTLFRLAECYENIGRRASAWNAYLGSAAAASAAGETKRAEFAKERAKKIESTVPYLIITVNQRPLSVQRDGEVVDEARWGTKIAVDPGEHLVVAEAPGKQRFTASVVIVDAATTVVAIPALLDTVTTPTAHATTGPDRAVAPVRPPDAHATNNNSGLRRWSIILSGTGLAALGAGAALSFTAPSNPDGCRGACAVGTGLMIGGALVTATGIAFFLASFGDGGTTPHVSKARPFELSF
jgi:hypothetical protein